MGLWIRSQDRETLIMIENVSITNDSMILGNLVSDDNKSVCDYWILGQYKTKRRALEVLDEIQRTIAKNQSLISLMHNFTDLKGNEEGVAQIFKDMIYEMPLE